MRFCFATVFTSPDSNLPNQFPKNQLTAMIVAIVAWSLTPIRRSGSRHRTRPGLAWTTDGRVWGVILPVGVLIARQDWPRHAAQPSDC